MKYPFLPADREIFPRTFLKDVRIRLVYPKVDFNEVDKDELKSLFDQFKGAGVDLEKLADGVELTSEDESIKLSFSLSSTEVSLRAPSYKTFDLAKQFLAVQIGFVEALGVKIVSKLIISKYNELRFQFPSPEITIQKIMKGIYSEELMQKVLSGKEVLKNLTRWEKELKFDNRDETDTLFTIECGFNRRVTEGMKGILALTTRIETAEQPVEICNLPTKAEEYNIILDNAFRWCVRDEILQAMRKKA